MRVYHRTNAGEAILRHGFENGSQIVDGQEYRGVFVSEAPIDDEYGDQLLTVELPDTVFAEYEWTFASGYGSHGEAGAREALVPAGILNAYLRETGANTGASNDELAL